MKCIGIVMRKECFDQCEKWFINDAYVHALQQLDAVLFPICSYASLAYASKHCNGLLIPGGYDISSSYWNQELSASARLYSYPMDCFDFACVTAFIQKGKAILGICRGMQLLNVYFHGSLHQEIDTKAHAKQHLHKIMIQKNTFLAQLYTNELIVNSYHHQAINKLGKTLQICAQANDGIIEAFQHKKLPILAVQWHPEKLNDDRILPYFVNQLCA